MEFASDQLDKSTPDLPKTTCEETMTKESLLKLLLNTIGVSEELNDIEAENFICNYFFVLELAKQDLRKIQATIDNLKQRELSTPKSEDYLHKKIRYFTKLNYDAMDEVKDFLTDGILRFVLRTKGYKLCERETAGESMFSVNMRYDYSFFERFYDIDYDFGTEVKFRFLPGVDISNMLETVQVFVSLHQTAPDQYADKIDKIVSENNCIECIKSIVQSNYILRKRTELFESLRESYSSHRYQTYVTLATIQLEGVFSDCCEILNGNVARENAGTLVEKAEKVFDDQRMKQAFYPYFAFDMPLLRNEVAHKGMTEKPNLFHCANELTLDLYMIVYWANRLCVDKYFAISQAYEKVFDKQQNGCPESQVFLELFSCYQMSDRNFLNVLAKPEDFSEELDFYRSLATNPECITIKEQADFVSSVVKSEAFWIYLKDQVLPSITEHKPGKPYDPIDFISHLRNVIIPVLTDGSPEKLMCQQVSKELKAFDKK